MNYIDSSMLHEEKPVDTEIGYDQIDTSDWDFVFREVTGPLVSEKVIFFKHIPHPF